MKEKDLQNIYGKPTQDFHNSVLYALCKIDDKSNVHYRKRSRAMKIALVCAIVAVLGTTTAVAASTKFFGLFSEQVGDYGLDINVIKPTEEVDSPEYVKLILGYLPEGVIETPNTYGTKFSVNGEASEKCFSFSIIRVNGDYDFTINYITNSYETEINGRRVLISEREFEENSDDTQYVFQIYFEDRQMVVSGMAMSGVTKDEVMKVIENISLVEGTKDDCFHDVSDAVDNEETTQMQGEFPDVINEFTLSELNSTFDFSHFTVKGEVTPDYSITVTSIEERNNSDGLIYDYFLYNGYEFPDYEEYFNSDGSLISTYEREDTTYGDGINSLDKTVNTTVGRHFYVVTIDVTANGTPDEDITPFSIDHARPNLLKKDSSGKLDYYDGFGNAEIVYADCVDHNNIAEIANGETRKFTYGIVVDDDVIDKAYVCFTTYDYSNKYENRHHNTCIKLRGNE